EGAAVDYYLAFELTKKHSNALSRSAELKRKLKDYKGAVKDYTKSIELDQKKDIYLQRKTLKIELQDFKGAIEDYSKVIEFNSELKSNSLSNEITNQIEKRLDSSHRTENITAKVF
ncbi:MAG: hypothetical protein ACPH2K_05130, partial [Flavicella sp.]